MQTHYAQLLYPTQNILGEGACWHKKRNSLMWVDIEDKKLHEFNFITNEIKIWKLQKRVSLILETPDKNILLLAIQGAIVTFNTLTEAITTIAPIEECNQNIRTNDGSIDPLNRIWVGTMALNAANNAGKLYCINQTNNKITVQIAPVTIPNGMVWTKDKQNLYFIDSPTYTIKWYKFDTKTGNITYLKDIIKIPETLGMPDGMCADELGMLWVAIWGGACVLKYNPHTGQCLAKIEVPAPQVTSCIFDKNNYKNIYITSARVGMTDAELEKHPLSGAVFKCTL
jgi:sugar lactone lactonase YvrE